MKRATIIYAREPLTAELISEVEPLLRAQYEEIAWRKDKIKFEPDYARYFALQKSGSLRCYIARQEGLLVGYAVYFIAPHLHYSKTVVAKNDIVYVERTSRGALVGLALLQFAEEQLKADGVHAICMHIKRCMDWSPLAKKLGYEDVESSHQKWVGA